MQPKRTSKSKELADWPSRPGQEQYEWEEPRTVNSKLGGTSDGPSLRGVDPTANRVDRLRLLGNGVVPNTCERAIRILLERLHSE